MFHGGSMNSRRVAPSGVKQRHLITPMTTAKKAASVVETRKFNFLHGLNAQPLPSARTPLTARNAPTMESVGPAIPLSPSSARERRKSSLGRELFGEENEEGRGEHEEHEEGDLKSQDSAAHDSATVTPREAIMSASQQTAEETSAVRLALNRVIGEDQPQFGLALNHLALSSDRFSADYSFSPSSAATPAVKVNHEKPPNAVWRPGESTALAITDGKLRGIGDDKKVNAAGAVIMLGGSKLVEEKIRRQREAREKAAKHKRKSVAEFYGVSEQAMADATAAIEAKERRMSLSLTNANSSGDQASPSPNSNRRLSVQQQQQQQQLRRKSVLVKEPSASSVDLDGSTKTSDKTSTLAAAVRTRRKSMAAQAIMSAREVDPYAVDPDMANSSFLQQITPQTSREQFFKEHATEAGSESPADRSEVSRAYLRKKLSEIAATTLGQFNMVPEMSNMIAPTNGLPPRCRYQHLHSLNLITELKGVHNVTNGIQDGQHPADGVLLGDEEAIDAPPPQLQQHYLMRRDAAAAARREEAIVSSSIEAKTKKGGKASGKVWGGTTTTTTTTAPTMSPSDSSKKIASSPAGGTKQLHSTRTAQKMIGSSDPKAASTVKPGGAALTPSSGALIPQPPAEGGAVSKDQKGQRPGLSLTATTTSAPQHAIASPPGTSVTGQRPPRMSIQRLMETSVFGPQKRPNRQQPPPKSQPVVQSTPTGPQPGGVLGSAPPGSAEGPLRVDSVYSGGVWSREELEEFAEDLQREQDEESRPGATRRRDKQLLDDSYEKAAAERRLEAIRSGTVESVGAEAKGNLSLFERDPKLFKLNGEDTDAAEFPDFPLTVEDGQQHLSSQQKIDEERQRQKFERGLLTRQLQRNRKLVDDRDNPLLDWKAWRGAASAAFTATAAQKDISLRDIADRMQFQWRSVSDEMGVHNLPCYGAQETAQEALLVNTRERIKHEQRRGAPAGTAPLMPKAPSLQSHQATNSPLFQGTF